MVFMTIFFLKGWSTEKTSEWTEEDLNSGPPFYNYVPIGSWTWDQAGLTLDNEKLLSPIGTGEGDTFVPL